jgi:hypothetical protein
MVTCGVTQEKERTKVNVYTLKASSSVLSSPIYTGRKLVELLNPNVSRKYSTAFPLFHSIDGLISKTYTNKKIYILNMN